MSTVIPPGVHRVHPLNGGVMDTEKHQRPHSTQFKSIQDSPSQRTGPPRSLSFAYSLSIATSRSKKDSNLEEEDVAPPDVDAGYSFASPTSDFRGALEYISPTEPADRKGKRRESRDEGWSPRRWFHESPKAERPEFDFGVPGAAESHDQHDASGGARPSQCIEQSGSTYTENRSMASKPGVRPALLIGTPVPGTRAGHARWRRLRLLIPHIISQEQSTSTQDRSAVVSNQVNITDELISGGLATLMPRLWFERDEKNHRRVPILLHRLRIRVSDSLHPMHSSKAVFRIECEYANGASRWVVYRQLRDFLSLHTHYTVSNIQNHNVDKMPEFPRTSLPYFKYLKKEGRDIGQAEFARLQRESLENYLLDLIRAVMFHPSSNRIAAFLEISALSISLARSGGAQYKAGVLHIESSNGNSGGGFGRKSIGWRARKEPKWCALREGYLVVLEEPGELKVWDVFILDSDFRIERPKRYYRQGLNFLNSDTTSSGHLHPSSAKTAEKTQVHVDSDCLSVISSIKSRVSKIFHVKHVADDNNPSGDDSSSSSSISLPFRTQTPLLDPSTNADPMSGRRREENEGTGQDDAKKMNREKDVSKHTFYIVNSQMRLKISAQNERQTLQWITALEKVATTCLYTGHNRFDSFAPVRSNVATQWLVDGRDYFWNLSRAILLARESIYIHDWWLSPEVELRRPNKGHYRLERLLERKAKEGVMIYIILYQEVSSRTTPTDSNYAKQRLLSLHPNILVQRSPSHFQTGTFYWAHHEKLCVIDQTIAFTGGLDLCFGRWDTPQHILTDDIEGTEQSEIWPGKDYSNPRISDFYELNKPEEDMYDRTRIPRMPWHDVALQVVGQPARDLARHFIQRWNYLLRIKNHSRTMPFLLPPPEFRPGELSLLGLTGTCEMQICRSAGPWSMGSTGIEQSIQNAYLKAIQMSEHFVYIENQFFITSTIVNDVKIENHIGDAIVHRIIRAHREGTNWKCCVIIPLLPGFTFPVDHSDASAIRIILACQNYSISRGPYSIFGRLRREGINPDDYISFFSLRNWAKMRGDVLTTEQVYVHAKVCIVDDRFAIIGSANINERSQRGDRDSELAAVISDTDLIDCTMGGQPFKVGRFAHLLRVRLMREHLGIDVDALDEADIIEHAPSGLAGSAKGPEPDSAERERKTLDRQPASIATSQDGARQELHATQEVNSDYPRHSESETVDEGKTIKSVLGTPKEEKIDAEQQTGTMKNDDDAMALDQNYDVDSELGTAQENGNFPGGFVQDNGQKSGLAADGISSPQSNNEPPRMHEAAVEAVSGKVVPEVQRKRLANKTWEAPVVRPHVEADKFEDPISDAFWKNVWVASAAFNTEIYRKVFHAIPDDTITTWKQYKEFIVHHERLNKRSSNRSEPVARVPSEAGDEDAPHGDKTDLVSESEHRPSQENTVVDFDTTTEGSEREYETRARHSSRSLEPFEQWEKDEMEEVLTQLNGHLVSFPTRFLEGEDEANNFLFNADRMLPLPIYN